jgi:hypothetical protein
VLIWAALFGGSWFLARRSMRGALVCAAAVVSHWVLDLIVHHPDLPLWPGGEARLGLGLWNSLPGSLGLELAIFGAGVWLYVHGTTDLDRAGSAGLWSLVAFLLVVQAANVFGAPPPSVAAVAWVGHTQWLLVAWAYWVDHHRRPRSHPQREAVNVASPRL